MLNSTWGSKLFLLFFLSSYKPSQSTTKLINFATPLFHSATSEFYVGHNPAFLMFSQRNSHCQGLANMPPYEVAESSIRDSSRSSPSIVQGFGGGGRVGILDFIWTFVNQNSYQSDTCAHSTKINCQRKWKFLIGSRKPLNTWHVIFYYYYHLKIHSCAVDHFPWSKIY